MDDLKECGILFSAPMVRALLDGSKTQTRRVVKPHPSDDAFVLLDHGDGWWPYRSADGESANVDNMEYPFKSPYGQPGDRLWVRETWYCDHFEVQKGPYLEVPEARDLLVYRADDERPYEAEQPVWRPSIHMPRWASRIQLEITGVRVERLQEIGEADACAEGVTIEDRHTVGYCAGEFLPPSIRAYRELWESINGASSWDDNPWVWVVEFKRIEA